ncbi:MAG: triose-phosphate isomerase [Nanoarchaeota archaeon]
MSRRKLIAGNWKMHKTVQESVKFVNELKSLVKDVKDRDILIFPPFTSLNSLKEHIKGSNIKLGAQNLHHEDKGAFTGEISAGMIKELCSYVIIGHSERRQYNNEDNELINKKLKKAIEHGLTPIVCMGEKLEERESGNTNDVIKSHVCGALEGISNEDMLKVIIAYEPVWAIGTGKTATPKQAEEAHIYIRSIIKELYGKVAGSVQILYGGSVKSSNAAELLSIPDIDGALVGGAALDALEFSKIVKF